MNKRFAIVDIETTGGMVKRDKITEIAIVIHDGNRIIDQWDTLINPERSIPDFITNITGITNEMVSDAPKFYEVAKKIVEMTEGAIFVAHNVRFDYGFIRAEFSKLGFTYTRKQLCTVRMSRKTFPGLKSYSLGNLIKHFNIHVNARHRALDDTLATAELFDHILEADQQGNQVNDLVNRGIRESKLPANISLNDLHDLPESPGVYYFLNQHGQIVYIGKSINIQKRVMQHFAKITDKAAKLQQKVHEINYTLTGSELIALLLENKEIKKHQPEINRALRHKSFPFAIYAAYDLHGYIYFGTQKKNKIGDKNAIVLHEYPDLRAAKNALKRMISSFELCSNRSDQSMGPGSCFSYKVGKCRGACLNEESPDAYNERAQLAIEILKKSIEENLVIIDTGREPEEKSLVAIVDGKLYGWGYASGTDLQLTNLDHALQHIQPCQTTPEDLKILHWFIQDNRVEKMISF
jgi:DNA polymerase-3 subunit epsilon